MCFVDQVNETPEAGPAGIMYELYYLNYCTIVLPSIRGNTPGRACAVHS
jgi:hypothetical protein